MDSFARALSALQRELVGLLGVVPSAYFTGGTVLSGYLGHRTSLDVDVFVTEVGDVDLAGTLLQSSAASRGWTIQVLRRLPGFRRFRVGAGDESTLVDIAHEAVPQVVPLEAKPVREGVRVDSLEDLIANKLCAVLGRNEVKDLVDLYFLSESGVDVVSHLRAAHAKDGGMEPATLAFVLKQMPTDPAGLRLLRPVDAQQLAAYRDELVATLLSKAWPEP